MKELTLKEVIKLRIWLWNQKEGAVDMENSARGREDVETQLYAAGLFSGFDNAIYTAEEGLDLGRLIRRFQSRVRNIKKYIADKEASKNPCSNTRGVMDAYKKVIAELKSLKAKPNSDEGG